MSLTVTIVVWYESNEFLISDPVCDDTGPLFAAVARDPVKCDCSVSIL